MSISKDVNLANCVNPVIIASIVAFVTFVSIVTTDAFVIIVNIVGYSSSKYHIASDNNGNNESNATNGRNERERGGLSRPFCLQILVVIERG